MYHDDIWCPIDPCEDCQAEEAERIRYAEEQANRKCEPWCASLHQPHKGQCFELYSHRDTCPGKPDCIHEEPEEEL